MLRFKEFIKEKIKRESGAPSSSDDDRSYLPPEKFRETPADKAQKEKMDADPIRKQLLNLPPPRRNLK